MDGAGPRVCSNEPIPPEEWIHVVINFGDSLPLEMFINGELQSGQPIDGCDQSNECGAVIEHGIDGNNNPWVLGASSILSTDNTTNSVDGAFEGILDHVRISRMRRNF